MNRVYTFERGGFHRYDWTSPCRFCYRRSFLQSKNLVYPIAKSGEDGPFVEMTLYHAKTFETINKLMFSYWQNMDSCVHTTSTINAICESYKALRQEEMYFSEFGVSFDADESFAWMCAAHLPKICATSRYSNVKNFMNAGCLKILHERPDIRFGNQTWRKIEKWRSSSYRYWLSNRIIKGIPLWCKDTANSVPGIRHIANYCFNRYHRKFAPIHNR